MKLIHLSEGFRYFRYSLKRRFSHKRYTGSAREICEQIVKACWNGRYFQNSAGHYREFWCRDFGWCVDSLLELGYRKEVLATLEYAVSVFEKHNKITTAISPAGVPFSFPDLPSIDSIAWLFYTLNRANAKNVVLKYRDFLQDQVNRVSKLLKDGLVSARVSSIRDHAIRKSGCYDNLMVGVLARECDRIGIKHDFSFSIDKFKTYFWNDSFFVDDLGEDYICGDANVFPFFFGFFGVDLLEKAVVSVKNEGLDYPFPLSYGHAKRLILLEKLVPDWENHSQWTHMGPLWLRLVKSIDKHLFLQYLASYKAVIERDGNFFEVYTKDSKPYKSWFYMADDSMLWACNLVNLL